MRFDSKGVKRRRQERLRRLREKIDSPLPSRKNMKSNDEWPSAGSGYSPYFSKDWREDWLSERTEYPVHPTSGFPTPDHSRPKNKWLIQTVVSLFLLSFVYLLFQTESTLTAPARQAVTSVMSRPFDFQEVAAWYDKTFGENPTLLPTISRKSPGPLGDSADTGMYIAPVTGTILTPFSEDGQGILLSAGKHGQVQAIDQGWVVFAGEHEKLGKTIVIRHQYAVEAWYANVDRILVKKDDWVQAGETIATLKQGTTGKNGKSGVLYFALKQENRFINPNEVIRFE